MASLASGYHYDIFVSYRHKDDKYDKWVTTFVNHLRKELEATFRDEISIYFDNNRTDGVLPTHDVESSLKEKLKCLVFIPVISHTYCDTASYAWANEFRTFVEQASSDRIGLKVRLPNGNYSSRVLPVIIHDLQSEEKILCERIMGGPLRGIEFIYREPGVNRPLRDVEDNPHDNQNHTTYRNQINKVANSVKDIISSITRAENPGTSTFESLNVTKPDHIKRRSGNAKFFAVTLLLLLLAFAAYLYLFNSPHQNKISIAVLPFKDLSSAGDQGNFTEGVMREIMNGLFQINGILVPSSTATEKYKGIKVAFRDIERELNVNYLLEGDVTREADSIRISVRLFDGKTGEIRWWHSWDTIYTSQNLLKINRSVADHVAARLNIAMRTSFRNQKEFQISNEAYDLYLKTKSIAPTIDTSEYRKSMRSFEEVTLMAPSFAPAYVELALFWIYKGALTGDVSRDEVVEKTEPLLARALELDKNNYRAHVAKALVRLFYFQDFRSVDREFRKVKHLSPANTDEIAWFSDYLHAMGRHKEALDIQTNAFTINKSTPGRWISIALAYYFNGQKELALKTLDEGSKRFPVDGYYISNKLRILTYYGDYKKVIDLCEKTSSIQNLIDRLTSLNCLLGVANTHNGNAPAAKKYLDALLARSEQSAIGSPSFFAAAVYAAMGDNDSAFRMLEKSRVNHEVELYWLKVDPLFNPLHSDARFNKILDKIGF